LNSQQARIGKYGTNKLWDGKMVRRVPRNSILKGMPSRGRQHTVIHHESGRRISVRNPKGPKFWDAPHLAFWVTMA
jgi:site-specific DNA recombinase